MAKTGGAVQKLSDKSKRNATARRMGTLKPIIARSNTPHREKAIAYLEHQRAIHGVWVNGVCVREPTGIAVPQYIGKGDGLPDEVIRGSKNWQDAKPPKTMAERAAADKRNSLKSEMRDGWTPREYVRQPDAVETALARLAVTFK